MARARPARPVMPLLRALLAAVAAALAVAAAAGPGANGVGADTTTVDGTTTTTTAPPPPPPPTPVRTIHLVPHSHDDGGWLKTFDQYLYGARQDIQQASVGTILDSVLSQLRLPPPPPTQRQNATTAATPSIQEQRTFAQAEVGFFRAWWRSLPKRQRRRAVRLVKLGLLEFTGGGTVQHDEATAHWRDQLDQTSRGHRWLAATFGPPAVPFISWQLDPFGHSTAHAELFGSPSGGHHAFIYGRSDWRDRERRAARGELEHVWRPSASFSSGSADALALAYLSGNYGPPPGLDWNWGTSPNGPIVDDSRSPDYNAEEFLKRFDEAAQASFAAAPRGSTHALWMMGSDFTYSTAAHYYRNMDRLVKLVNGREDSGYRVVYSTPGRYLAARAAEAASVAVAVAGEQGDDGGGGGGDGVNNDSNPTPPPLSLRTDDLFPYSDDPHSFWTGYFTSRPESKLLIRAAGARLQAARQLAALSRIAAVARVAKGGGFAGDDGHDPKASLSWLPPWERAPLPGGAERLEAAVALAQHHDAVTGTAKQAVVRDYHRRLYEGMGDADALIGEALRRLMRTTIAPPVARAEGKAAPRLPSRANRTTAAIDPPGPIPPEPRPYPRIPQLVSCPLHNVSHCLHSAGNGASRGFLLVAYNPLSRPRVAAPLRVPVRVEGGDDSSDSASSSTTTFQVYELVMGIGAGWKRPLVSQLLPRSDATSRLQASTLGAVAAGRAARRAELEAGFGTHDLAFVADEIPAFGYSTFLVKRVNLGEAESGEGGGSGNDGPIPAALSSERRFGRGGEPVAPGTWPKPVVVGNYDPGDDQDGIRLSFDYVSGRLSSVVGGGGFEPQSGGGESSGGESGSSKGWGPLPATMALASHLPYVGKATQAEVADAPSSPFSSPACPLGPADPRAAARAAFAAALAAAAAANGTTTTTISNVAGAEQSSGAYIFRPDQSRPRAVDAAFEEKADGDQQQQGATTAAPTLPRIASAVLEGPVVSEVRQDFTPQGRWASLALRVWPLPSKDPAVPRPRTAGAASAAQGAVVEVEWTVGPLLPAADDSSPTPGAPPPPLGREAIFRLSTALLSEGVFFTDSNGREMQQRRRDRRPWRWPGDFFFEPQSANYHPITSGAALGDGEITATLATDRAQGAASLADGELEVMVHRATPADDARGVGEPLRETAGMCRAHPPRDPDGSVAADACGRDSEDGQGPETPLDGGGGLIARGTFRVRFSRSADAARLSRLDQEELLSPLVLQFAPLGTPRDVVEVERAFGIGGGADGGEEEEGPAAAAAVPRWGLSSATAAAPPDGGIGGGDPDSPIRVVTLMRSDGLHGERDAEDLCEDEEDEEGGGDGDGSLTPPLRCGAQAQAAAAALPHRYIVRLAHVFAAGEHPDKMSKPATFDLNILFARIGFGLTSGAGGGIGASNAKNDLPRIRRVTELSLTASVPRADLPPRPKWRVAEDENGGGRDNVNDADAGPAAASSWPGACWRGPEQPPPPASSFPRYDPRDHGVGEDAERAARGIVELYPMEVRTFEVELAGAGGGGGATTKTATTAVV